MAASYPNVEDSEFKVILGKTLAAEPRRSILTCIRGRSHSGPYYATNGIWESTNSLFAIWDGINDVKGSCMAANVTISTYATIFEQYRDLIDTLYNSGSRNFILVTVPPLQRHRW